MRLGFLTFGTLPLFSLFFLWSFGTGAMQLARPLFAASFGVPVFLVSLITSSNGVARLVTGPLTGYLMDRWGRKPLLLFGVVLRGITAILEAFSTSYLEFLVLEFVGGIGVSIWATGASVLIADVSERHNRGMAVATRGFSVRLGTIAGPLIGAWLAVTFGLRSIFLFNALTKVVMLVIMLSSIRETRPEPSPVVPERGGEPPQPGFKFASLFSRPFLAVVIATLTLSGMTQGVMQALFPVYVDGLAGFGAADVGVMMTIAGITAVLISFPNGVLVDRFGRRKSLTPGLLVLALSAYLLATNTGYWGLVLMVIIYGIGEGISTSTSQTYAIDLAPTDRRGAFLGAWSLLQNGGAIVAAALIGLMADGFGFWVTFQVVAAVLAASGLLIWLFGSDPAPARTTPRRPDGT